MPWKSVVRLAPMVALFHLATLPSHAGQAANIESRINLLAQAEGDASPTGASVQGTSVPSLSPVGPDEILGGKANMAAEGKFRVAEKRATAAEGKFRVAEKRATDAEGKFRVAEKRAQDAEGKLSAVEKRATDAEGKLSAVEKRATDAEGKFKEAAERAQAAEGKLSAVEAKLEAAEKKVNEAVYKPKEAGEVEPEHQGGALAEPLAKTASWMPVALAVGAAGAMSIIICVAMYFARFRSRLRAVEISKEDVWLDVLKKKDCEIDRLQISFDDQATEVFDLHQALEKLKKELAVARAEAVAASPSMSGATDFANVFGASSAKPIASQRSIPGNVAAEAVRQQLDLVRRDLEGVRAKCQHLQDNEAVLRTSLAEAERRQEEMERRFQESEVRGNQLKDGANKVMAELSAVRQQCKTLQAALDDKGRQLAEVIGDQLPAFCQSDAFVTNMEMIRNFAAKGNPQARMLMAGLQSFHAADRSDADARYLRDAAHEIGRFLAALFRDACGPDEAVVTMQAWAREFNAIAQGRFSIQVPILGMQVDPSWMSARPGTRVVSAIETWAVRDSKGAAGRAAEVA